MIQDDAVSFNKEIVIPSGLIAIYKPQDWSSNDVVGKVKNILRNGLRNMTNNNQKIKIKIGHGGTLDPLAEGVLVLGIGEGTKKLSTYLSGAKNYRATGCLGIETDTLDSTGTIIETMNWDHVDHDILSSMMESHFIGNITQIPPMFSALKKNGTRLYELARKGQVIEREPRSVTISSIKLIKDDQVSLPYFIFETSVSGGTYVRTLISDLAKTCNTRAHMTSLIRTKHGPFELEDSLDISKWTFDEICECLINSSKKYNLNFEESKPAAHLLKID